MNIADDLTQLTGSTPLVRLRKINDGFAQIAVKLEYYNPAGSIKDRPALRMITDAEKSRKINKDTVIIEPTSGNTGIGLAMVCAIKGYKIILTMPETMSLERRKLLKAYGAQLVLTKGDLGMKGAVDKALELSQQYENSFIPFQFENPSNPQVHYDTTAEEIWNDTDGKIDIITASVGTGGTICGCAKKLKEKNPNIIAAAVEPFSSQLLGKGTAGKHKIQGIGANFVPKNFDYGVIDEIIPITDEQAIDTARCLAQKEGILAGISGGANVMAAIKLSQRPQNKDKLIVTIIPDYGERYLSGELYDY